MDYFVEIGLMESLYLSHSLTCTRLTFNSSRMDCRNCCGVANAERISYVCFPFESFYFVSTYHTSSFTYSNTFHCFLLVTRAKTSRSLELKSLFFSMNRRWPELMLSRFGFHFVLLHATILMNLCWFWIRHGFVCGVAFSLHLCHMRMNLLYEWTRKTNATGWMRSRWLVVSCVCVCVHCTKRPCTHYPIYLFPSHTPGYKRTNHQFIASLMNCMHGIMRMYFCCHLWSHRNEIFKRTKKKHNDNIHNSDNNNNDWKDYHCFANKGQILFI